MASSAERLHELFRGFSGAHGRYVVKLKKASGKMDGQAYTDTGGATVQNWQDHLDAKYGVGIIPLLDDDTVAWCGIDVDKYSMDLPQLVAKIRQLKGPFTVFRSKSGGAHLLTFFLTPCPAEEATEWLRAWAAALGFGGSEIFPKQTTRISDKDIGNWLNMPYFGAGVGETTRYALDEQGAALRLEDALALCELGRLSPEDLPQPVEPEPNDETLFEEGPPCLQTLQKLGGFPEGMRNAGMFNVAVYLKKRYPDDWKELLHKYNDEMCDPPLKDDELRTSLMKSFERKDYAYKCKEGPIAPHCNRSRCLRQRFGVGDAVGGANFEISNITKLEGDPVHWIVEIDGRRMMLTTDELMKPALFAKRYFELHTRYLAPMPLARWAKYIDEKAAVADIVPEPDDEETTTGLLLTHLRDFCSRTLARTRDELDRNQPWVNEGRIYFKGSAYFKHLTNHDFKNFVERQVIERLRTKVKFDKHKFNIKTHYVNVYSVDYRALFGDDAPTTPAGGPEAGELPPQTIDFKGGKNAA